MFASGCTASWTNLGDEVRITVIAAGFDGGQPKYKRYESAMIGQTESEEAAEPALLGGEEPIEAASAEAEMVEIDAPSMEEEVSGSQEERREKVSTSGAFGDDLDLPEFFR